MSEDAFFAIHAAYDVPGKESTPQQTQDALQNMVVDIYQSRTGVPREQIQAWLQQDTLFTPREALELGFVDEIVRPQECFTEDGYRELLERHKPKLFTGMLG